MNRTYTTYNSDQLLLPKFIFSGKFSNTVIQLLRYTIVGGLAFIIDFGMLIILTEIFNVNYLISALVGFTLGLIVNYFLSIKWVFNQRNIRKRSVEFLLFTLIGMVGLALNELSIWFLTEVVMLYYMLSKIITTVMVYMWNFFARKYLLFTKA